MRSAPLTELPGTADPVGDVEALLHRARRLTAAAAEGERRHPARSPAARDPGTLIARLIDHARSGPLTAQLTAWPLASHEHPGVRALHTALLANPGPVCLLLPAGAGDDPAHQGIGQLAGRSTRLRVSPHPLPPLTVIDGTVAVTSVRNGAGVSRLLVIQDVRVTQTLQALFTALWHQATVCVPVPRRQDPGCGHPDGSDDDRNAVGDTSGASGSRVGPPGGDGVSGADRCGTAPGAVTDPLDTTGVHAIRRDRATLRILQLMATGVTDDTAARQLGCSTRTYRRRVATLMQQLNATSRFQAGLYAAHHGLLAHGPAPLGPSGDPQSGDQCARRNGQTC